MPSRSPRSGRYSWKSRSLLSSCRCGYRVSSVTCDEVVAHVTILHLLKTIVVGEFAYVGASTSLQSHEAHYESFGAIKQ